MTVRAITQPCLASPPSCNRLKSSLKEIPDEALSTYIWGIFDDEDSLLYYNRVATSVDNPPSQAWKVLKGTEPAPALAVVGVETGDVASTSSKQRRGSYAESVRRRSVAGTTAVESKSAVEAESNVGAAEAKSAAVAAATVATTTATAAVIAAATKTAAATVATGTTAAGVAADDAAEKAAIAAADAAAAAASSSGWQNSFDLLLRACNEEQQRYLKERL